MSTELLCEPTRSSASKSVRLGVDAHTCPECNIELTTAHGSDNLVVACPDCGQCLAAPASWVCRTTEWSLAPPTWPFRHTKYSGWVAVAIGLSGFGLAALADVSAWLRAGATLMGAALSLEGVFRIVDKARKNAASRPAAQAPTPDSTHEFGALKAAFVSKNSIGDSLLLCLMAAAGGSGVMWVVDWLADGVMHPKLLLIVAVVPLVLVYVLYRSVRLATSRQHLIIREHGMDFGNGVTKSSFAWSDIRRLTAVHLGDAIDEDAIEIDFHDERRKVSFTRAKFPDLETIWARILLEANEEIELGTISVDAVNKAAQQSTR